MGLPVTAGSSSDCSLTITKSGSIFWEYVNKSTSKLLEWKWYDEQKTMFAVSENFDLYVDASVSIIERMTSDSLYLEADGLMPMVFVADDFIQNQANGNTDKYADYALCNYDLENVHYDFYLAYTETGGYDPDNIDVQ
jgi:hypothetical protein